VFCGEETVAANGSQPRQVAAAPTWEAGDWLIQWAPREDIREQKLRLRINGKPVYVEERMDVANCDEAKIQ
jgi:hypothetical protein